MGLDAVAAGAHQGVAAMGEGVGAMTGQPWRMTPSMLAMGRRRAEVGAVGAAATVAEVAVEAVAVERVLMAGPSGGNMTAGTAQAAGERPSHRVPFFVSFAGDFVFIWPPLSMS